MTAARNDTDRPKNVMEALARDMVEGTDRAAQMVLAEMAAGAPAHRLTDDERRALDAEIEASFDNMPV